MTSSPRPLPVGAESLAVGLVAALATAAPLALAAAAGLDLPLGSDAPLWGLSVLDVAHGNAGILPPLYGGLAALPHLLGLPAGTAARLVSALAHGGTALAAAGLVRQAGGPPGTALVAALAVALHPDLLLTALLTQPDALTAAVFTAVALGLAAVARRATPATLAAGGGALVLAWLVRESGLVVLGAGAGALGLAAAIPGPGQRRLPALGRGSLAVAATLALSLGISSAIQPAGRAGVAPPWLARLETVAVDEGLVEAGSLPTFLSAHSEPWPAWNSARVAAQTQRLARQLQDTPGDRRAALLRVTVQHGLLASSDLLIVLGLGALGLAVQAAGARRPRLLLALLPTVGVALAAMLVWTQRRHVSVLLPVGLAGAALLTGWARPPAARALLGLVVALAVPAWQAPITAEAVRTLQASARQVQDAWLLGRELRERLPPDARICGTVGRDLVGWGGVLLVGAERAGCQAEGEVPTAPGGQASWMCARVVRGQERAPAGWAVLARQGELTALWPEPTLDLQERRRRARLLPVDAYVPVPRPPPDAPVAPSPGSLPG